MSRIHSYVAALSLIAGALACVDARVTAPLPSGSILGVYALHSAAGAPPPALIQHLIESETGRQMQVYVMSDTLALDGNGHYLQRAEIEVRSGSTVISRAHWSDHGTYALHDGAMHFESDYLQNVRFDGTLGTGHIALTQDLVGEGATVTYVLHPAG